MCVAKKKKIRVAFRKNRQKKPRRQIRPQQLDASHDSDELQAGERISGKGDLTRYRTIVSVGNESEQGLVRNVDEQNCLRGRVLTPRGAGCLVQAEDGSHYDCTVRQLLWTMASQERTAVVAGDRVLFRPSGQGQGVVERIEPRQGTLSRQVRGRQHVLVANVDQVLIVLSAVDPPLKPGLIDRYLVSAARGNVHPVLCINKVDLADLSDMTPVAGRYAQLGYEVVLASAQNSYGIPRLRHLLQGKETCLAGQSGVGKSSLINAVQPGMELKTGTVSVETRKGRHTTTNARLLELDFGGWVVDTPGVRQFELWDVPLAELEQHFVEFGPFRGECQFRGCSHTHESGCAVKRAVHRGFISLSRFDSYYRIRTGDFMG